jgi:hypothetical protein
MRSTETCEEGNEQVPSLGWGEGLLAPFCGMPGCQGSEVPQTSQCFPCCPTLLIGCYHVADWAVLDTGFRPMMSRADRDPTLTESTVCQ